MAPRRPCHPIRPIPLRVAPGQMFGGMLQPMPDPEVPGPVPGPGHGAGPAPAPAPGRMSRPAPGAIPAGLAPAAPAPGAVSADPVPPPSRGPRPAPMLRQVRRPDRRPVFRAVLGRGPVHAPPTHPAQPQHRLCQVCASDAAGIYYGAFACRGCASFFRKAVLANAFYVCNGRPIGACCRCRCKSCRLAKCHEVGMRREEVGAAPARPREHIREGAVMVQAAQQFLRRQAPRQDFIAMEYGYARYGHDILRFHVFFEGIPLINMVVEDVLHNVLFGRAPLAHVEEFQQFAWRELNERRVAAYHEELLRQHELPVHYIHHNAEAVPQQRPYAHQHAPEPVHMEPFEQRYHPEYLHPNGLYPPRQPSPQGPGL